MKIKIYNELPLSVVTLGCISKNIHHEHKTILEKFNHYKRGLLRYISKSKYPISRISIEIVGLNLINWIVEFDNPVDFTRYSRTLYEISKWKK